MTEKWMKQCDDRLKAMERHLDWYAHELHTTSGPEQEYYEKKCEELMKEKRWLKFKFLVELRQEIRQMKRRMANGETGLKTEYNQLKRKYFQVRG